jgi:hypothetical protein
MMRTLGCFWVALGFLMSEAAKAEPPAGPVTITCPAGKIQVTLTAEAEGESLPLLPGHGIPVTAEKLHLQYALQLVNGI